MSWNECLYWYARERGGTYFGMWPSGVFGPDSDGALLLEAPKGPVLVCAQVTYSGQYGTHRDAIVRTRAELERPYTLRVKKQSSLREGEDNVYGKMNQALSCVLNEVLTKELSSIKDYVENL